MRAAPQRLGKAALVVVACVLVAMMGEVLVRSAQPSVMGDALGALAGTDGGEGVVWRGEASRAVDVDGVLEGGESWAEGADSGIPEGFAEEVITLDGYTDVRVGAAGAVVGFTASAPPTEVYEDIQLAMVARGWTAVPSGSATVGSFVKATGSRTWACVTCVQVGNSTSVVVQCTSARDEKG